MKHYLYAATLLFSIALVFQAQADACRSWDNSKEIRVALCDNQTNTDDGANLGCSKEYPLCYKSHAGQQTTEKQREFLRNQPQPVWQPQLPQKSFIERNKYRLLAALLASGALIAPGTAAAGYGAWRYKKTDDSAYSELK